MNQKTNTQTSSWETSHEWYDKIVGPKGHYYHQQVILPNLQRLLGLKASDSLLDLGCGQGILARHLPKGVSYTGVDISPSLIRAASRYFASPSCKFVVGDAAEPLAIKKTDFSHCVILLALQNIEHPLDVLKNAASHLKEKGKLVIVLGHPCFRIPRQSSWGVDLHKKIQYRRIDRYLTPLSIPISTHPGKKDSPSTLTFHYPLSAYTQLLKEAGFVIASMEEWCSDKTSEGGRAAMENRARDEFPLFLAVEALKV